MKLPPVTVVNQGGRPYRTLSSGKSNEAPLTHLLLIALSLLQNPIFG